MSGGGTPKRGTVIIGYAHGGQVSGLFASSLLDIVRITPEHVAGQIVRVGGPMIADHRNEIVRVFLTTNAEWLWMVDTDMVFKPETLRDLLKSAHWKDRPVVGALCYGSDRRSHVMYPTIYWWSDEKGLHRSDIPLEGMVEVDGTGAACLLIHRSVLEKVCEEYPPPKGPFEFAWYDMEDGTPQRIGEDLMFCVRVKNAGFPIHVNCGVEVGHYKPQIIDTKVFAQWHALNNASS